MNPASAPPDDFDAPPEARDEPVPAAPSWIGTGGRWYIWDGGFLLMGSSLGAIPAHRHHAIQISIATEGSIGLRVEDGAWLRGPGLMVSADVDHQFDGMGASYALILVDPESREGRWLSRSLKAPIQPVPEARVADCAAALRSVWEDGADAAATAQAVHGVVRSLCVGPPPPRPLDERVTRALEVIRQMDTSRLSLEAVAKAVYLSPSRFAHLFSEQVGLPFRRYLLWRRITRAMVAVARGNTLSGAAHTAGFADSAHLTRTCYQMFGLSPSAMLRPGELWEIPAPFELPVNAPGS